VINRVEEVKQDMLPVFEQYKIGTNSAIASSLLEGSLLDLEITPIGRTRSFHDIEPAQNQKVQTITKLYYKVLEELIRNQESRINESNLATVLANDSFHRALMACCVETVFFVHNINCVSFDEILGMC
jgi:hypothetical protein